MEGLQFKKAKGVRRSRKGMEEDRNEEQIEIVGGGATRGGRRGLQSVEKKSRTDDKVVYDSNSTIVKSGDAFTVGADEKEKVEESSSSLQQVVDGEKIYTGEKGYGTFFKKGETKIKGGGLRAGPVKATGYVKMTTLVDYNPSICKDYKQTGYCGYGQNCKYMHDRGDYKSGWEIDKEWDAKMKRGGEDENFEISSSDDEDELPFACFICRNEFDNPVVTKCGHYFCESCALAQEKKKKRCFVCNEPTSGIFNPPTALIEKMKKKKQQQEQQEAAAQDQDDE
jgi:RING finger protein 113A